MGNYQDIQRKCLKQNSLHEDPDFPANEDSLGVKFCDVNVVWQRPHQICPNAKFKVSESEFAFSVGQGSFGNPWLLSAMSCIAERPQLLEKVLLKDQSFDANDGYCGAFHFVFHYFGKWHEVIIDDRLPTDGQGNLLFTGHSNHENEFWCALMEKAYAKLHGGYDNISTCGATDAFQELTGGIVENWHIGHSSVCHLEEIRDNMLSSFDRNSFLGCCLSTLSDFWDLLAVKVSMMSNRSIPYPIHSVTDVRQGRHFSGDETTNIELDDVTMIKISSFGSWSLINVDTDYNKNIVTTESHEPLEFWIKWEEFVMNFDRLYVCHFRPDAIVQHNYKMWYVHSFVDEWRRESLNGGNILHVYGTRWEYPLYYFRLLHFDSNSSCRCLVNIEEPSLRFKGHGHQDGYIDKGLHVYKIDDDMTTLPLYYCCKVQLKMADIGYKGCVDQSEYFGHKSVSYRFELLPGNYLIAAASSMPVDSKRRKFYITFFSEEPADVERIH